MIITNKEKKLKTFKKLLKSGANPTDIKVRNVNRLIPFIKSKHPKIKHDEAAKVAIDIVENYFKELEEK